MQCSVELDPGETCRTRHHVPDTHVVLAGIELKIWGQKVAVSLETCSSCRQARQQNLNLGLAGKSGTRLMRKSRETAWSHTARSGQVPHTPGGTRVSWYGHKAVGLLCNGSAIGGRSRCCFTNASNKVLVAYHNHLWPSHSPLLMRLASVHSTVLALTASARTKSPTLFRKDDVMEHGPRGSTRARNP